MFGFFKNFFKRFGKKEVEQLNSGDTAKERLHLVLMQDRANVSADLIDMMKQDIIDDIKKYVDVDEKEIDVKLTNQIRNDGSNGSPTLYANIPITNVKSEMNILDSAKKMGDNIADGEVVKNSILNIGKEESKETKTVKSETSSKKSTTKKSTPKKVSTKKDA